VNKLLNFVAVAIRINRITKSVVRQIFEKLLQTQVQDYQPSW